MNQRKTLQSKDLVPMDLYEQDHPIQIDLAYAQDDNRLFGTRIYRSNARLWLHQDLAKIVCTASRDIFSQTGKSIILYDGLRTTDAQNAMLKTQRVRNNPHWLKEPRLLSPPGAGAHPRAMAVDMSIANLHMGTDFDDLSKRAHRDYAHPPEIMRNREILSHAMINAAKILKIPLLPLPQEWWDFRFPPDVYEDYAPLSDTDLPPEMRCL